LRVRVIRSNATPPDRGQPPGTVTQFVEYIEVGVGAVARAIQFVMPDGALGGSGLPDPKWLVDGSRVLVPSHNDSQRCPDCPRRQRRP
jgi:hypothetical protein